MILVTGGTGYIGSHTCVELTNAGRQVVIVDDLSNSKPEVVEQIRKITGVAPAFYRGSIREAALLDEIFATHKIEAVIHFAGHKAVGESVQVPMKYYENNVGGSIVLIQAMLRHNVKNIVFSSSATVYGACNPIPYVEGMPTQAISPYGSTKIMIEQMLRDQAHCDPAFRAVLLRYFNPVGAHRSGLLGEDPQGIPNNLMPYIMKVAAGQLEHLNIFGGDYPTQDGTGVRDYIHVCDLAQGHLLALEKAGGGISTYNLGSGKGTSVLELVHAFERVNGVEVPYEIVGRRAGDLPEFYADASKASSELGWQTTATIEQMCQDSWHYISKQKDA